MNVIERDLLHFGMDHDHYEVSREMSTYELCVGQYIVPLTVYVEHEYLYGSAPPLGPGGETGAFIVDTRTRVQHPVRRIPSTDPLAAVFLYEGDTLPFTGAIVKYSSNTVFKSVPMEDW